MTSQQSTSALREQERDRCSPPSADQPKDTGKWNEAASRDIQVGHQEKVLH